MASDQAPANSQMSNNSATAEDKERLQWALGRHNFNERGRVESRQAGPTLIARTDFMCHCRPIDSVDEEAVLFRCRQCRVWSHVECKIIREGRRLTLEEEEKGELPDDNCMTILLTTV